MKRIFLIIALLLLPEIVQAQLLNTAASTVDTFYVNTASSGCTGGGTCGTTNATSGGSRAYVSLEQAQNDRKTDLVTANRIYKFVCSGTAADTTQVYFTTSWTTDSTHFVWIYTDPADGAGRHNGVWSTSKYRLSVANFFRVMRVETNHIRIEGLQIEATNSSATDRGTAVDLTLGTGQVDFVGNIVRYNGVTLTTNASYGITDINNETNGGGKFVYINNIIYGFKTTGMSAGATNAGDNNTYVFFNNTLRGNGTNLNVTCQGTTDVAIFKNNLLAAPVASDFILNSSCSTYTHSQNASSDALSPDTTGCPGATSCRSLTFAFVNTTAGSEDLHLDTGDAAARDAGTDLSADTYAFSTDIDRDTRPQGSAWDIGADEAAAGGGGGGGGTAAVIAAVAEQRGEN